MAWDLLNACLWNYKFLLFYMTEASVTGEGWSRSRGAGCQLSQEAEGGGDTEGLWGWQSGDRLPLQKEGNMARNMAGSGCLGSWAL